MEETVADGTKLNGSEEETYLKGGGGQGGKGGTRRSKGEPIAKEGALLQGLQTQTQGNENSKGRKRGYKGGLSLSGKKGH